MVIPTWNAAAHLAECLAAVAEADETIVVDGGSSDDSVAIANAAGATVIPAPRGRGQQLAAGADAASGDALLFLHADTVLDREWSAAAEAHLRDASDRPACFTFALDDPAWQARILERGVAVRSSLLALPYGDQGLLLTRALYRSAGGFHPLPLMEDVDLLRRLPRPVVLAAVARTSAGRWRSDGWWARSARNLTLLALWRGGVSEARLATLYDRSHRTAPSPPPTAPPGA